MPYATEYRVKGSGAFPDDMLRYVPSVPRNSDDAASMAASEKDWSGVREIELVRVARNRTSANFIAEKRWESFGWKVISKRKSWYFDASSHPDLAKKL